MAVAVTVCAREAGDEHIRTKRADHAHDIGECDVMPLPFLESFFGSFRIPEIGNSREPLLYAVIAVGGQHLQSSHYTEYIEEIAAQFVLSAFATVQSHQQSRDAFSAGFEG